MCPLKSTFHRQNLLIIIPKASHNINPSLSVTAALREADMWNLDLLTMLTMISLTREALVAQW